MQNGIAFRSFRYKMYNGHQLLNSLTLQVDQYECPKPMMPEQKLEITESSIIDATTLGVEDFEKI